MGLPQWSGWGASPTQQRFQPAERARLSAGAVPKLTLKWAFGFPGAQAAYGQPSVAGNHLFVGSSDGTVYALAADTGCLHWTFKAGAQVRTAISIGMAGNTLAIYFGDQKAFAYAVNANTGALLWKTQVDEHVAARITGAPTLAGRPALCAGLVFGRRTRGRSDVSVLHVPRKPLGARRGDRRRDLEVVHHCGDAEAQCARTRRASS